MPGEKIQFRKFYGCQVNLIEKKSINFMAELSALTKFCVTLASSSIRVKKEGLKNVFMTWSRPCMGGLQKPNQNLIMFQRG